MLWYNCFSADYLKVNLFWWFTVSRSSERAVVIMPLNEFLNIKLRSLIIKRHIEQLLY